MKTKLMALAALNSLLANMGPEELKFIPATEANAKEAIAALEADIANLGEPYGWQVQGLRDTFKGNHAELDAKAEAARVGGTAYAFPIYTTLQEPAAPELLDAVALARAQIKEDRDALAQCHTDPSGYVDKLGAAALSEYDETLSLIDAAIAKATGEQP